MPTFTPKPGFRFDLTPPREAQAYFRRKGWRVGFDFRDVWREEHAVAFTVAKAMTFDVLQGIRGEVDRALSEGRTLRQFRQDLEPTLRRLGWWGEGPVTDPKTGETRIAQLGSPRRLRTIYRANLRTARAAGQWERAQRTKRTHPYFLYRLGPSREHRELHVEWNGTLLPIDDAWWDSHMPPNGWGCKCRVRQLSRAEAERRGGSTGAPPVRMRRWRNKRTGQVEQVPEGIDPGWDTNPGKARERAFLPREIDRAPPVSFPPGTDPPPLPAPREAPEDRLLPKGESPEVYARAFLAEFGADVGESRTFIDAAGQPVTISEHLFQTRRGRWKAQRRGRGRMMRLLADTLRDPDEIWWSWVRGPENRWQVYRQYLARWRLPGRDAPGFLLFQWGADGWAGVTAFDPDRVSYVERQRDGVLAYRREE